MKTAGEFSALVDCLIHGKLMWYETTLIGWWLVFVERVDGQVLYTT